MRRCTVAVSPSSVKLWKPSRNGRESALRAAFSGSPSRAATRLAVRAEFSAWVSVQAPSISCQTQSAANSSQNTIPISSVDAWPRSSRRRGIRLTTAPA